MKSLAQTPCRRRRTGFTLIEVIITLTIFVILTACVFGIMTAVFQSSNDIRDNQNRRDEVSAFGAYLKNCLANLTSDDRILSYRRGNGEGLSVNGVILEVQGTMKAIDATPQDNGLFGIRLAQPGDFDPTPSLDSFSQELDKHLSALVLIPLLKDVHTIKWRFRLLQAPDWQPDWTSQASNPDLVECSVQLAGDDIPTTMDFSIPRLVAPAIHGAQPVATDAH
jgi:prepilin-type N-terminal cleavage/methylation domain-containing protein